jgi:hypothetical protein
MPAMLSKASLCAVNRLIDIAKLMLDCVLHASWAATFRMTFDLSAPCLLKIEESTFYQCNHNLTIHEDSIALNTKPYCF